jgi:hypothetical protein
MSHMSRMRSTSILVPGIIDDIDMSYIETKLSIII